MNVYCVYPSLSSNPNGLKGAEANVVLNVVSSVKSVLILLTFLTVAGHESCPWTKQYTINAI